MKIPKTKGKAKAPLAVAPGYPTPSKFVVRYKMELGGAAVCVCHLEELTDAIIMFMEMGAIKVEIEALCEV